MVNITIQASSTNKAEKLFERYYKGFGNIVYVEMKNQLPQVEFELIFLNEDGDIMTIKDGLTSGYVGEGPNGTVRVLKKAGFEGIEDIVHTKDSFKIEK